MSKSICKVEVVEQFGRKLYRLSPTNTGKVPSAGWVEIKGNLFFVHHCNDLPEDIYYVWEPRVYKPPDAPVACPRCRYRMDYRPKHERQLI